MKQEQICVSGGQELVAVFNYYLENSRRYKSVSPGTYNVVITTINANSTNPFELCMTLQFHPITEAFIPIALIIVFLRFAKHGSSSVQNVKP